MSSTPFPHRSATAALSTAVDSAVCNDTPSEASIAPDSKVSAVPEHARSSTEQAHADALASLIAPAASPMSGQGAELAPAAAYASADEYPSGPYFPIPKTDSDPVQPY